VVRSGDRLQACLGKDATTRGDVNEGDGAKHLLEGQGANELNLECVAVDWGTLVRGWVVSQVQNFDILTIQELERE